MTYQQMAYIYDEFMSDAPYESWVSFAKEMFKQSNRQIKQIADLGCGTGEITCRLAKEGYSVVGVDNSSEMLSHAEQKASNQKLDIHWLQQDLRTLKGLSNFDTAISFCDVINYITKPEEVKCVFKNVANLLNDQGLFLFDVHSLYHVKQNMVNNTFAEVTDKTSYIWFCEEGEEPGDMYHDLTFFLSNKNHYIRFDESHYQKVFSVDIYKQLLDEAGFNVKGVYSDFSIEEEGFSDESERIFFFAEKRSG